MGTKCVGVLGLLAAWSAQLMAQGTGTVTGRVTRQDDQSPLAGVSVTVEGTGVAGVTGTDGRYTLPRVPAGQRTVLFRWLGYRPHSVMVSVTAGGTATVDAALVPQPIALDEVVVSASRTPERVVEAPAAVSIVDIPQVRSAAITGQVARAIANIPGVDVVQNGVHDFNINARGFNSTLNRRVLVLQDGRDLALAFLGAQEWAAAPPPDEAGRIEMVRGPGSALYGANAYSGVLAISTPSARDVAGTRITLGGGELSTFKGDLRHAGVAADGRFGYKLSAGYSQSDTWSRSRTSTDGLDLSREYQEATDRLIGPEIRVEQRPLNGQTKGANGAATGDRDPIRQVFGAARFDYYADNGAITTLEGGATQVENEIFVTGIGRVQVDKAIRPWARATWAHPNYNLMAWYSGRNSIDPQYSLLSGGQIDETSAIWHFEGQYNRRFARDKARIVLGASYRSTHVDTKQTLLPLDKDNRTDAYYSGYGQLEYQFTPQVRAVAAARVDDGDLFKTQVSPKGALVFSPNQNHSIRATFNQAFQTPSYSEFFLQVGVAPPTTGPRTLERGLEQLFQQMNATGIGAGLGLPNNLPWNFDSLTFAWALGNESLDVEKVTGWEIGYKGNISNKAYVTIDGYINQLKNFVTDLLPGVNPAYSSYSLTDAGTNVPKNLNDLEARVTALRAAGMISAAQEAQIKGAITQLRAGYNGLALTAGPLLATRGTSRALIVSYTNAGRVSERGVEVGGGVYLTSDLRVEGSFTFFDFEVKDQAVGDVLLPNTPETKANLSVSYSGPQGLDISVSGRFVDGYDWASGVFFGRLPASETIDVNAGYRINNNVRIYAVGTNVLDQQRYHIYGGSVIGRRVLGGITATF